MNIDLRLALAYWQGEKAKDVEVYYHNTKATGLDEFEFNYRAANSVAKGYHGKGIFTHAGSDEYFNKFGKVRYAVIVKKGSGKTMEEENGNGHYETFFNQANVFEMVEL